MIDYLIISIFTALAVYVVILKIGIRKVLAYEVTVDIVVTIVLMILFSGTLTGIVAATFAGLFFSIIMYISKLIFGYEKYEYNPQTKKSEWVRYRK